MYKLRFWVSMFGTWILTVGYDVINQTTGKEPRFMLYIAVGLMIFGIYSRLRTNNKTDLEKES